MNGVRGINNMMRKLATSVLAIRFFRNPVLKNPRPARGSKGGVIA
jgi:hypothetical protein